MDLSSHKGHNYSPMRPRIYFSTGYPPKADLDDQNIGQKILYCKTRKDVSSIVNLYNAARFWVNSIISGAKRLLRIGSW
jgi:hypothetical protein